MKDDKDQAFALDAGGRAVEITHPDRVWYPDEGITKLEVAQYYQRIAPVLLPYLKDRPQNLLRHPDGIAEKGFFQKDVGENLPDWLRTEDIYSETNRREIDYLVCNDAATLAWMNNLGCIQLNPWNSRTQALDRPDYIVMDLDPAEGNTFEQVIEVALAVKEVLDRAGVPSYPKTSGSTGLHVYVPMGARYTYEEAGELAEAIAIRVHELLPGLTSLERAVAKRPNQIYLDHLQNRQGQTVAAAYGLRPKPGAPVSAPLEWAEVRPGLSPRQFSLRNIFERLEKKGDLFRPVLGEGVDLKKAMKGLAGS